MLPNESLLVVLGFADYRTLVIAKLAGTPFLRVVTKFAEELARRRSFRVTFYTEQLLYYDGERRTSILYEAGNETSIVAACRELNAVIGPHFVDHLYFCDNTWNMPGVSVIFEAAPQLKYAEDVEILIDDGVVDEAFMRNFAGLKELRLWLDYDAFSQLSWTFLREESARELRLIEFTQNWRENVRTTLAVEDLVRYCVTLPNRQGGEALELEFMQTVFSSRDVGRRIIELLKGTGCELTVRMWTRRRGELLPDQSEYTVDVDDETTRYTSEKSGIVVEVEESRLVIQSTAKLAQEKPRTSNDVSPVVPLVQ